MFFLGTALFRKQLITTLKCAPVVTASAYIAAIEFGPGQIMVFYILLPLRRAEWIGNLAPVSHAPGHD